MNDAKLTVLVTRHSESNILVERCLKSLAEQKGVEAEIFFLDQKRSIRIKKLSKSLSGDAVKISYIPSPKRSEAQARNYGLEKSKTRYVAFCDVDTILEPNWASEILHTFHITKAAIVGTRIIPVWSKNPRWYHKSKYILEFYSMLDLSNKLLQINKIIGASFAVDKKRVLDEGYFNENLGRANGKLLGGVETDLCARVVNQGLKVYYTPHTTAGHHVSPERMKIRWLWKRTYYGGFARASRGGSIEAFNKSRLTIYDFLALLLISPAYFFGFIRGRINP